MRNCLEKINKLDSELIYRMILTRPEVDDDVYKEYRVGQAVEGYPSSA